MIANAKLLPMSIAVVGVDFDNVDGSNRRFEIALCSPGEPVEFRPEPRNPFDPNAVAVVSCRGTQLGYVRAERAPRISQLIRESRELQAVFQRRADFGAWVRIAFDGDEPILSDTMLIEDRGEIADPEPEFYPDEEWPDD